jgi:hypothetical protein
MSYEEKGAWLYLTVVVGTYVAYGGIVLAVAMAVPFGLAMAKAGQFWIANAMYAAFVAWALATTLVRIVAYRRGL